MKTTNQNLDRICCTIKNHKILAANRLSAENPIANSQPVYNQLVCQLSDRTANSLSVIKLHSQQTASQQITQPIVCKLSNYTAKQTTSYQIAMTIVCQLSDHTANSLSVIKLHSQQTASQQITQPIACQLADHTANSLPVIKLHSQQSASYQITQPIVCQSSEHTYNSLSVIKSHSQQTASQQITQPQLVSSRYLNKACWLFSKISQLSSIKCNSKSS